MTNKTFIVMTFCKIDIDLVSKLIIAGKEKVGFIVPQKFKIIDNRKVLY